MPQLTKKQIDVYNSDGFITPLDIYTPKEAAALRQELEDLEALHPDAVVLVATTKALKMHGGVKKEDLQQENVKAVIAGCENLGRHIRNIGQYGVPVVVYDVCKDDCIIFRGVHEDKMSCPVCNK